jgi:hypothetical protein
MLLLFLQDKTRTNTCKWGKIDRFCRNFQYELAREPFCNGSAIRFPYPF